MINIPKGTKDVLPNEAYKWQYIENIARDIARIYNVKEVRTPVFEHTELFVRSVGETTDVVGKEMYTFLDKGDRSITLKPEGTAGVARAFIENGLFNDAQPTKMFYFTPVFRYERPQAGRLREHHQFGVEVYGSSEASMDAEVISIAKMLFDKIGVEDVKLYINSIGCKTCRGKYNDALKSYLCANKDDLCKTCLERMDKNPLRVLDCKEERCSQINKNAPKIIDYICDDCSAHFKSLQENLDILNIKYEIDPQIVRGLDYYTKTVFEFVTKSIGAKSTVCGGGRYDNLVESIGGKPTPCVGFGMGLERLILLMENLGLSFGDKQEPDVYVISASDCARAKCVEISAMFRAKGVSCEVDQMQRNFKSQIKHANKIGAKNIVIIGEDELSKNVFVLKNMTSGEQEVLSQDELVKKVLTKI